MYTSTQTMGLFNLKEILFFYGIISISPSASQSFSYKETVLTGSVIKTFLNIEWFQCLELCYSTPDCLSYNFCTGTRNIGDCELNRCGVHDAVQLCGQSKALRHQKYCVFHHFKEYQPRMDPECTAVSHQDQHEEPMLVTGNFTCSGLMSIYADGNPTHMITREGQSKPVVLLSCPFIVHPPVSLHLPRNTQVISIEVQQRHSDEHSSYAPIIGGLTDGLVTNREWKCANTVVGDDWLLPSFNDSSWSYAKVIRTESGDDDEEDVLNVGIPDDAMWITYAGLTRRSFCRIKRK